MNMLIFILSAYLMGCLAAVPAGPVQIEVIRRAINGHLKPSLVVIFGAFMIDFAYGLIAFFGIAPFLEEKKVMAIFWLFGGMLLSFLGVLIIRNTLKGKETGYGDRNLRRKRWAFFGGLWLSATNPVMILWWLSGARISLDIGLIKNFNRTVALAFLTAGSLGIASYLIALALLIYWAKKFVSLAWLRKINILFGAILLIIAIYFIFTSLRALMSSV